LIKVAFWYDRPQEYTGGLHYIKNLLYSVSLTNDGVIQPYVFFGTNVDEAIVERFARLATVIRTPVLARGTLPWFVNKVLLKFFGRLWVVNHLMRRHGIQLVSHAAEVYGRGRPYRLISWLPDFQYLHLPELFPKGDQRKETLRLLRMAAATDAIVLSSFAARRDFSRIASEPILARTTVLQFVSQPAWGAAGADPGLEAGRIEAKYGFRGRFFLLPNQFWSHKNHRVVFEAVNLLKQRGIGILVLCTGNLRDYRLKDNAYADGLRDYIGENSLHGNIRILGLIDYSDVLLMMRLSIAVLNPSRFEGWSSTVEEARSMGKRLVLSDIDVHVEQNPPGAAYFPADDVEALAEILMRLWNADPEEWSAEREAQCRADLLARTLKYGRGYVDLVRRVAMGETRAPAGVGVDAG
jgi:glycosyltransferase involved in cell wall biosynthesis